MSAALRLSALGRRLAFGMRTSSRTSSAVSLARIDNLYFTGLASKPLRSRSTMKPFTSPSSFAHTMDTAHWTPLVIHILEPLSTYSLPSSRAVVRMPPGFDPKSASVSPKHPIAFPLASAGSHLFFCSSSPKAWMGYITRPDCTDAKPVSYTHLRAHETPEHL